MGIEIPWRSKLVRLYKPLNVTGYNNKNIRTGRKATWQVR